VPVAAAATYSVMRHGPSQPERLARLAAAARPGQATRARARVAGPGASRGCARRATSATATWHERALRAVRGDRRLSAATEILAAATCSPPLPPNARASTSGSAAQGPL